MAQENLQLEPKDDERKRQLLSMIIIITFFVATISLAVFWIFHALTMEAIFIVVMFLSPFMGLFQINSDSMPIALLAKVPFSRRFRVKRKYLVVFTKGGERWASWTQAVLGAAGDEIVLQHWKASRDFKQCMQEWEKQRRRIISIVSPDYMEALLSNPPGFHEMKSKHSRKGRNTLVCVREGIYKYLDSIPGYHLKLVDLSNMNALQARNSLLNALSVRRHAPDSELGSSFPGARPTIWNIPEQAYFTGRQEMLKTLYKKFLSGESKIALQGLRGIGKTEIAKAYAQRNYDMYSAGLWLCLSDGEYEESLRKLALKLPLAQEEEERKDIAGRREVIMNWLNRNEDWLLILDDCQNLARVDAFIHLPIKGHILLTSHVNGMTRFMHSEQVKEMNEEEGEDFLLHRAYPKNESERLTEANRPIAREIVKMLGGIPEAIELAATYIREGKCPLAQYPGLYHNQRQALEETLSRMVRDQAYARVIYAWYVCFEEVQKKAPGAARLLQHATFLDPDTIQREILKHIAGVSLLARNDAELNKIIWELLRFSLMGGDENVLTMNTHVQNILKGRIDVHELPQMVLHTFIALSRVFPDVNINTMRRCREYAPHVQSCLKTIKRLKLEASDMTSILAVYQLLEIAQLYDRYGCYLRDLASYEEARELFDKGLELRQQYGTELQIAQSKSNIAELDYAMGKYEDARLLYEEVVQVREQKLGVEHLDTAAARSSLAILYDALGKGTEAEALHNAALATWEKVLASGTFSSAYEQISVLRKLGYTYRRLGKYPEAEKSYKKAKDLCEREKLSEERALCLANLASCYIDQKLKDKYDDALFHYKEAMRVYKSILGEEHPQVADIYHNLSALYALQGDPKNAQSYYQRALEIYQKKLPGHPQEAAIQSKLARF